MTEHPAGDVTGAELDEPLVDDLIDETRGPEEDPPAGRPTDDPAEVPPVPEPPD
ncbi:hypothetical protein FB561_2366 [Kribbella amoyensis]|uniref:Uncharacterized protein n=1 Tax=Kribbella amoyensis TaxID=996641 RepID=A0A561BQW2_9ACTN|nr:hypothetical protein [Kribbella amoyensis]TWD81255.1 hypothetical protein FB561_2366 [Kribbella amoyensis]